ncbi:MAG: low molecular weight phosphotyrosine protein phosphatase [Ruminococcaceae bacterium]|nr:low molecular weight phosphotyrosine protein phosphatase [Oscillospiraceae bacterium]
MIKIMFICHGNICRSPMAEFVMKDMIEKEGLSDRIFVSSSATSTEEIGNPPHRGTRKILDSLGISYDGKYAVQLKKSDYDDYDYLVCMDSYNIRNAARIIGDDPCGKLCKLLDFAGGGDISDPWYTGDFDLTYEDVKRGCEGLLKVLKK